jgi:hypothetical protein
MLYYVADSSAFLARMRAVVQPDGLLVVSMWRHPGDRALWSKVDREFPLLDRVEVRNRQNLVNPKGWLIASYRAGATGAP